MTDKKTQTIEYVSKELKKELLSMPIWTLGAFGNLKDGDVIPYLSVTYDLMYYLIKNKFAITPGNILDEEYYNSWKVKDFKDVFKEAVKECRDNSTW